MAHLSQAKNSNYLRRASHYEIRDGQKIEVGWGSQIQGIITDKPGKLRGDRTDILMFEECFGKGTKVIMSDYTIKNISKQLIIYHPLVSNPTIYQSDQLKRLPKYMPQ